MKRGFYLWNIPNCEGGDPLKIAAVAMRAGLTDVFVKIADGTVRFGVYNGVDVTPGVVAALKAVGIRVWGWQYIYGNYPEAEAQIAISRIKEMGLDAFIVNAEVEFKKAGWAGRADTYMKKLRAGAPGVTLALSSYRFPHYHPEFPWSTFFKYVDVNMPQVYWLQAHNAAYQTQVCFEKFRAMAPGMPIMPTGPAWKENGWRPALSEIQDFERVSQNFGAELVSYWSWEHCRRDLPELWPMDVVSPKPPEPPPVAPEQDTRLAAVETKVQALESALASVAKALSELKSILK